ncbi:unnamed protein product [Linum trigynum]|uniref:Uncharacterized protein n=1 Tax=Linum trigynum TaxID=586398 RepID=A0AAV2GKJ2_9ROSI
MNGVGTSSLMAVEKVTDDESLTSYAHLSHLKSNITESSLILEKLLLSTTSPIWGWGISHTPPTLKTTSPAHLQKLTFFKPSHQQNGFVPHHHHLGSG